MTVIRSYRPDDYLLIGRIFTNAVHEIASEVYSREQCLAWASIEVNFEHWKKRCERKQPFVAVTGAEISGFLELDPDGHIDCAYINPRFQRRGIMTRLARHAIDVSFNSGIRKVYVEASICAKPMFEKMGFQIVAENIVKIGVVELLNYRMELKAKDRR